MRLTAAPGHQPADPASLTPLPGRLFVVGDPKQSIYRFRRADIAVYLGGRRSGRRGPRGPVGELPLDERRHRLGQRRVRRRHPARARRAAGVPPARHVPIPPARPRLGARARRRRSTMATTSTPRCCASAKPSRWPPPSPPPCARVGPSATAPAGCGRAGPATSPCCCRPARRCRCSSRRSPDLAVPYRAENASVVYLAPEIRDVCWRCAPPPIRPTSWRSSPACARRCTAAATSSCSTGAPAGGRWNLFVDAPEALADHPVGRGDRSPPFDRRRRRPVDAGGPARPHRRRTARCSRRRSPGRTPATCGGGCATSSTRPGRGPTPAAGACAATCDGPPTRPARAGPATRSSPSATTTPCGS